MATQRPLAKRLATDEPANDSDMPDDTGGEDSTGATITKADVEELLASFRTEQEPLLRSTLEGYAASSLSSISSLLGKLDTKLVESQSADRSHLLSATWSAC